jgi:alkylhydroperoxidase family enzyme
LLQFADTFLAAGTPPDQNLREELQKHFSDAEIVELTAGLALFMGFSKIAIALGGIPENMPVIQTAMPGV